MELLKIFKQIKELFVGIFFKINRVEGIKLIRYKQTLQVSWISDQVSWKSDQKYTLLSRKQEMEMLNLKWLLFPYCL